jgi:ABC-type sugar transport system ATPase subunit
MAKKPRKRLLTDDEIARRFRSGESLSDIYRKEASRLTADKKRERIFAIEHSLTLRKGELYGLASKAGLEPLELADRLLRTEQKEPGSALKVIAIMRSRTKEEIKRIKES